MSISKKSYKKYILFTSWGFVSNFSPTTHSNKTSLFLDSTLGSDYKSSHLSPMIRPSTTLHINLQPSFLLFKVLGCGKGATTATVNPQNCIPPFFTPLIFKSQVRSVPLRSSFFLSVSPPVVNETQEFFFKHFPGIYKFSLLSVSFLGHKAFFFLFLFFLPCTDLQVTSVKCGRNMLLEIEVTARPPACERCLG